MVVGIRQTSSATSTVMVGGDAGANPGRRIRCVYAVNCVGEQRNYGQQEDDRQSGEQYVQRDFVWGLLTFGAFDRAIIRSRKVSPGFEVIRTLSQSEITLVPPVTADRSPPDSRMTRGRSRR